MLRHRILLAAVFSAVFQLMFAFFFSSSMTSPGFDWSSHLPFTLRIPFQGLLGSVSNWFS